MTTTNRNPWPVLLVTVLGFFMIMLDTTIVYVATPSILSSLHASLDQILWVFNGYLLMYAVLLITGGRLGDLFGPRQLFAAGLVIFTAASALCGLSQDANQLIAARVIQGVGAALLAPQTLTILMAIFPPERRGAAFGITGAVIGVSTVAGPTLGGLIVTNGDWRWIFFLNVPIGIIALVGTFLVIPDVRTARQHRLDLIGVLLSSVALFAVVFGLIEGQRFDWSTITGWLTIPMVIGAGIALFIAFLAWERLQAEPLVPLGLFRDRNFSLMNWSGTAMSFAMQGIFIPITIYTQSVLGMTALQSGLTIAPMSLTAGIVAPFAGRLADRFGGKYLLMAGLALFGLGSAIVTGVATVTSTQLTFFLPWVLAGVGLGLVFAPMTTIAMRDIKPAMAGAASGVLNTTRQLGSVIGAAVVGAVLQNQLASAFHDQAVTAAAHLPRPFQQPFIDGFAQAAKSGLQVGRGQTGASLPANLPASVAGAVQHLVHDVFVNGYVIAMRPTVGVAVAVLAVASLSCLWVLNGRHRANEKLAPADVAAVA
ncbi:MAG TPA: DHA2 family efflux MFS transporter permease subunit [Candidatus Dormibacteraeota bacterium]|jgi:EmrB/QacA subfamily drug resistance transporter|nr:DHA2 family efflux MFS transporter permease subunit [Candidatus Dormibacteraeota bacterium]